MSRTLAGAHIRSLSEPYLLFLRCADGPSNETLQNIRFEAGSLQQLAPRRPVDKFRSIQVQNRLLPQENNAYVLLVSRSPVQKSVPFPLCNTSAV